jgi:hypothetical protein
MEKYIEDKGRGNRTMNLNKEASMQRVALVAMLLTGTAVAAPTLSDIDQTAAFKAAGFKKTDGKWVACETPSEAPYTPGNIDMVADLNGDGQPEAVISEGTIFCYGYAGTGFSIVSKQADGKWKLITRSPGIPEFLKTKGVDDWPDILVGGPGFCFPVNRWNGKEYVLDRFEYEGKRCKPSR